MPDLALTDHKSIITDPQLAELVLPKAGDLPSPPRELATLKLISALYRFDLPQVWHRWQFLPKS